MSIEYQNELEASVYYANKENDALKKKVKQLEKERQYLIDFIEKECVYDEHLQGYCFDLPKGKVRTLMFMLKNNNKGDKK